MKQLYNEMAALSSRGESFALATVISRSGSTPRSAGAKMLVKADGATWGTVGGGALEAQVTRLAHEMISTQSAVVREFQFDGKDAADMDAICGGQAAVLVEWMNANDPTFTSLIQSLLSTLDTHRKAWLITQLPPALPMPYHGLVLGDTPIFPLPDGLELNTVLQTSQLTRVNLGPQQFIIEPIHNTGTVFIFGAGHVSRSLATFTSAVGFKTIVLDDRPEFASPQRFPTADQVCVLDSFTSVLNSIQIDSDSYLVIVTRGHQNDLTVLAQLIHSPAAYIGMIGSRRKCNLIFDELRRSGCSDAEIARIHAPIGLPIQAETPEEIGISITAEMIQVRATRQK